MNFLETQSLAVLADALERLQAGFATLPAVASSACEPAAMREVLLRVADRLHDNYPYFHPLYAGQMLKPPHPVARAAYALAMWVNPNNHALDGGRATSAMEREAVAALAAMFGWGDGHLGHLCGGGTMANLEALWVASRLAPGRVILASSQAHYTHGRVSQVLGVPFEAVPCDRLGRMDPPALRARLEAGGAGTVVATMGTTGTGSVDSLPALLALREEFGFRLHADAAYGGYHGLVSNLGPEARLAFDRLGEVDSLVIDPHKHGLQPYGCGCVLFRDPSVGRFYKHDSPYTYFSSTELHLGELSLECSRPGAAAAALWATQQLLPLTRDGEFARMLSRGREAALELHRRLAAGRLFVPGFVPELDIVSFAPRAARASELSALSRRVFERAARLGLHLALAELPAGFFDLEAAGIARDCASFTCLRSVLMKPEHLDWLDRIENLLRQAAEEGKGVRGKG